MNSPDSATGSEITASNAKVALELPTARESSPRDRLNKTLLFAAGAVTTAVAIGIALRFRRQHEDQELPQRLLLNADDLTLEELKTTEEMILTRKECFKNALCLIAGISVSFGVDICLQEIGVPSFIRSPLGVLPMALIPYLNNKTIEKLKNLTFWRVGFSESPNKMTEVRKKAILKQFINRYLFSFRVQNFASGAGVGFVGSEVFYGVLRYVQYNLASPPAWPGQLV